MNGGRKVTDCHNSRNIRFAFIDNAALRKVGFLESYLYRPDRLIAVDEWIIQIWRTMAASEHQKSSQLHLPPISI